jgi:hypothetical protein
MRGILAGYSVLFGSLFAGSGGHKRGPKYHSDKSQGNEQIVHSRFLPGGF